MNTIQIPVSEYQRLQEELELLKNSEFLQNVNKLIDFLYQDKYGLYMGDYTEDLTESAIGEAWENEPSGWDNI
ncbi:MAG: hypothetical protein H0W58_12605 [Acidobacteria bacterium]|jgi:hypothetical protein|nr:hypothetical protein [Acidobacteriota bacterium]